MLQALATMRSAHAPCHRRGPSHRPEQRASTPRQETQQGDKNGRPKGRERGEASTGGGEERGAGSGERANLIPRPRASGAEQRRGPGVSPSPLPHIGEEGVGRTRPLNCPVPTRRVRARQRVGAQRAQPYGRSCGTPAAQTPRKSRLKGRGRASRLNTVRWAACSGREP